MEERIRTKDQNRQEKNELTPFPLWRFQKSRCMFGCGMCCCGLIGLVVAGGCTALGVMLAGDFTAPQPAADQVHRVRSAFIFLLCVSVWFDRTHFRRLNSWTPLPSTSRT